MQTQDPRLLQKDLGCLLVAVRWVQLVLLPCFTACVGLLLSVSDVLSVLVGKAGPLRHTWGCAGPENNDIG